MGAVFALSAVLVDMANSRGGDDNITVVLIHLANDASREAPQQV